VQPQKLPRLYLLWNQFQDRNFTRIVISAVAAFNESDLDDIAQLTTKVLDSIPTYYMQVSIKVAGINHAANCATGWSCELCRSLLTLYHSLGQAGHM
jgi:hypothetical protein